MFRRSILSALVSLTVTSAIPAFAQATSVSGHWEVHAQTTHAGALCVPQVGDQWWYDFQLTQTGGSIGGTAWRAPGGAYFGTVTGTMVGNAVSLTIVETFPGQTTTHSFALTVDPSGNSFSGLDDWLWTNGLLSCAGRDAVTGSFAPTRLCSGAAPAACPCGNTLPAGAVGGCVNSQGTGAVLHKVPSFSGTLGAFSLRVTDARPNLPGVLLQGATQISIPFMDGILCTGNPTQRLAVAFLDPSGAVTVPIDLPTGGIGPGSPRVYQFWYRDTGPGSPCGAGSNFSDALLL